MCCPKYFTHVIAIEYKMYWQSGQDIVKQLYHTCTHPLLLSPLRLTLATGTSQELPGCSCKDTKEALTAHWFRPPQSGLYWITLEEGCGSGLQKRAVQVGLADTGTASYIGNILYSYRFREDSKGLCYTGLLKQILIFK